MRLKKNKELLQTVKDRYKIMYQADQENRRAAMADIKFVNEPGAQWDANMKQERGERPCYEFNKLRVTGKRVINDMRANRPAGKVRAVEGGDVKVAEINEGLIRNIWNVSDADTVIDCAAEYQVNGGMGAWRVATEYVDDGFDQDICIEEIPNPFCLYVDPAARDHMKRDAEDWIYTEKITHGAFEKKYGTKVEKSDFEESVEFDDEYDWQDEDMVRVAEYWWKEPITKEIWKVDFGGDVKVVDSTTDEAKGIDPAMIKARRAVQSHKVMWCIASGDKILEGPTEWAGNEFPFVMVFGEQIYIDGQNRWWGLPRFAKDAQRAYNVSRTAIAETIAAAPQAKWWATQEQAKGNVDIWATAHKKNYPFLLYNADAKAPGPPQRMGGADVPVALIQESQIASEEIKAVTGIFDASLGMGGNEKSGRAIYARQQQGEIATYNYQDNMGKAIKRTYELLLDLIPEVYDTERELRILGTDGSEDYKVVNQVVWDPSEGRQVRVNDLQAGKYDVTVTVGPSFSTLRQEAAETYGQLGQQFPELMGVAGDLVFKSMDLPYAEDIAERLRTILPPQVQQIINKDKEMPPEVQQAMQQAEQAMAQVQEHAQLVQAAAAELEGEKGEAQVAKAEIKTELANLRAAKAEFDAHVAKEMSQLVQKEAGLTGKAADLTTKGAELKEASLVKNQEAIDVAVQEASGFMGALSSIDEVLAQFMQAVDATVGELNQKASVIERKTDRKLVGGTARRVNGKLVADVQYDDGSVRSLQAVRKDGQLNIEETDPGS